MSLGYKSTVLGSYPEIVNFKSQFHFTNNPVGFVCSDPVSLRVLSWDNTLKRVRIAYIASEGIVDSVQLTALELTPPVAANGTVAAGTGIHNLWYYLDTAVIDGITYQVITVGVEKTTAVTVDMPIAFCMTITLRLG